MLRTSYTSTIWGKGDTVPNLKRTSNIKNKFVAVLLALVTIIAFSAFETSQFSIANAHDGPGAHPDNNSKPIVWMRGGTFGNNRPNYNNNERNAPRIYFSFQRSHYSRNERDGPGVTIKYKITDTGNFIKNRSIVGTTKTFSFSDNLNTFWRGPGSIETENNDIDEIIVDVEDYDDMGNLKAMADRTGYAEGTDNLPRPIKIEILPDNAYHIVNTPEAIAADPILGTINCKHVNDQVPGGSTTRYHDESPPHARCAAIYYLFEDDDKPSAKIVANTPDGTGGIVPEDSAWQFKVELNILPARDITIPLTVNPISPSPAGTFYKTLPTEVRFGPSTNCSDTPPCEFLFDIINQTGGLNSFPQDAQFTVAFGAIPSADDFKFGWHNNNNNETMITLADDGAPTLVMTSDKTTLSESENIGLNFTVKQGSDLPTRAITVTYTIDENDLDFIDSTDSREVMIPLNGFVNRVFQHTILIDDDNLDERDSMDNDFGDSRAPEVRTIDVELTTNSGYRREGTAAENTINFTILDNEEIEVGISLMDKIADPQTTLNSTQNEIDPINLYLQTTYAPWKPIEVNFTATEAEGACLNSTRSATIHNTTQIPIRVVVDDRDDEIDCNISITLTDSTDESYTLSSTENMLSFTVKDDDLSVVSFDDGDNNNTVSEASDSQFTLTIPNPAPHAITINFSATYTDPLATADFFDQSVLNNGVGSAEIPVGQMEVPVGILFDDETFESQADITITITADTANPMLYTPNTNENSITLTVTSDDGVDALISAKDNVLNFTEDSNLVPTVVFSTNVQQGIEINFSIELNYTIEEMTDDEGSFVQTDLIKKGTISFTTTELTASTPKELQIPLVDNNTDQTNGTIVVKLEIGNNYKVLNEPNDRVTFQVTDDDLPALRLVKQQPEEDFAVAGETIILNLQRISSTNWNDLYVDIAINRHESIPILWRVPNRVLIPEGEGSTDIEIQTQRSTDIADQAAIEVRISENTQNFRFNDTDLENPEIRILTTEINVNPSLDDDSGQDRIAIADQVVSEILELLPTLPDPNEEPSPSTSSSPTENINLVDSIPSVSINSSGSPVNEGETVYFQISTTFVVRNNIPIEIRVIGNAIESSRTAIVNIKSGERIGILPVSTINDDKLNGNRTITATVQTGIMYELGQNKSASVIISDFEDQNRVRTALTGANQVVLPEIFSTTESQTSNAIDGRIEQYFNNESSNSLVFNGRTQFTDILTSSGGSYANESLTLREVIGNSSFSFDLLEQTGIANSTTVWGLGNIQNISGNLSDGQQTWAGDTFIGQLGLDARVGEDSLTGIAYSFSDAEVNYINFQDDQLTYKSYTRGLHPYFGWTSNDGGIEFKIQTGYGLGEVEIEYEDIFNGRLGTRYHTIAVESSKNLIINEDLLSETSNELNLIFDSEFSQQSIESRDRLIDDSQFEFWNVDIATEGKRSSKLFDRATLDRSLSIGLKRKKSLEQSVFGIGTNTSFDLSDRSGLKVSGLGNLIVPFENQIQSNIQGSLHFDRNQDSLGTQLEILGTYGNTNSSSEEFFRLARVDYFDSSDLDKNEISQRLISEIGYGFSVFDSLGSIIPYSGVTLTDNKVSDYRLGGTLKVGSKIELELVGKNSYNSNNTNSQSIELEGKINW